MTAGHAERQLTRDAIVVGYDKTDVAGRALDWAAEHAARQGRPLAIVHATGSLATVGTTWRNLADPATEPTLIGMRMQGDALLATAIARVAQRHPTLATVPLVVLDDPAAELVHLSRMAHLVVVGSRGHGLSRSIPTGQIGAWLARRATCPLVVVPDFNPGIVRQGVLVGVPITDDPGAVLEFAFTYASVHDLPLSVMHASRDGALKSTEHRRWLAEAMSGNGERFPDVTVQALLVPGRPAATLRRMAERMNLLVVGRHHATGLHGAPFGHVRSSVVDRSPCPTAVVPARVSQAA